MIRVGLDVDGVIRDLVSSIMKLWDKLGRSYKPVEQWELEASFGDDVGRIINSDEYAWVVFYDFARPYEGAIDFYHSLCSIADVTILTSQRSISAKFATDAWLKRYTFWGPVVYTSSKEDVDCDVYLDDGPPFIEKLHKAGKLVVVMDRPWNRHLGGYQRVTSYEEFLSLCEFLNQWLPSSQGLQI